MQDVDLNWVAMVEDPWNSALVGIFVWTGCVATVWRSRRSSPAARGRPG
jgi:hypothetical protein